MMKLRLNTSVEIKDVLQNVPAPTLVRIPIQKNHKPVVKKKQIVGRGQLLAETIRNTPELTRENIMQSAYSLDGVEVGLLLPGVSFTTNGAEDPFPIETLQIGQYNGEYFDFVGEPIDLEGQSAEFTPEG